MQSGPAFDENLCGGSASLEPPQSPRQLTPRSQQRPSFCDFSFQNFLHFASSFLISASTFPSDS